MFAQMKLSKLAMVLLYLELKYDKECPDWDKKVSALQELSREELAVKLKNLADQDNEIPVSLEELSATTRMEIMASLVSLKPKVEEKLRNVLLVVTLLDDAMKENEQSTCVIGTALFKFLVALRPYIRQEKEKEGEICFLPNLN